MQTGLTTSPDQCGLLLILATLLGGSGNAAVFAQDEPESVPDESRKPIVLKLDYQPTACAAQLSLEYFQRDDHAQVKSVLTNEDCAASSGEYTLQVRVRNADNEVVNFEFGETWSRSDAAAIESAADYYIGDDVDLLRVRARKLRCVCSDKSSEAGSQPPGTESGDR